jgi:DNA-binding NarL/FixJ family response regulator
MNTTARMSGTLESPDRQLDPLQTTGPEKTILLVDDSYMERMAIRAALETFTDFRVFEAANGAEGVKKARELKPDLVLLDLAMPVMNGLVAATVLKAQTPEIPVVVLSMYAEQLPEQKREMLHLRAVLNKEAGLSPLIDCVKKILEPA